MLFIVDDKTQHDVDRDTIWTHFISTKKKFEHETSENLHMKAAG